MNLQQEADLKIWNNITNNIINSIAYRKKQIINFENSIRKEKELIDTMEKEFKSKDLNTLIKYDYSDTYNMQYPNNTIVAGVNCIR
jgi:hypothetical protein